MSKGTRTQASAQAGATAPLDNRALTNAMAALANAINNFANAAPQAAQRAPAANTPVVDLYSSNQPFDLANRTGLNAFQNISKPLDEIWDGTTEKFPHFVISLKVRAAEGRWDAAAPQGIMTVAGHNILTAYHSITTADITAERTNRVDP